MNKILLLNIENSLFLFYKNQKLWNYFVDELFQFNFYVRFIKLRIYNLKNERSNKIEFKFYNNKIFK